MWVKTADEGAAVSVICYICNQLYINNTTYTTLRVTQFQFSVCMYCTCGRIDNKADLTWLDLTDPSPTLFWYQKQVNGFPKYMLNRVATNGNNEEEFKKRFNTRLNTLTKSAPGSNNPGCVCLTLLCTTVLWGPQWLKHTQHSYKNMILWSISHFWGPVHRLYAWNITKQNQDKCCLI